MFPHWPRRNESVVMPGARRRVSFGVGLSLAAILAAVSSLPASAAERSATTAASSCAQRANALALRTKAGRRAASSVPGGHVAVNAICHDFTGDRRRDVAFAISSGGSGGAFEWAVFRRRPLVRGPLVNRFRKVAERYSGTKTGLQRRRRLLVVTNPIHRSDDPNCCPTGGEVRRTYRVKRNRVVLLSRRRVP
jgi:hypothetical protein